MGHEVSQETTLDPDLTAENALLDMVPQLMDEHLSHVSCREQNPAESITPPIYRIL